MGGRDGSPKPPIGGSETPRRSRGAPRNQALFIGRPQQIFCAIATFPHFAQRKPGMLLSSALESFDDGGDALAEADAHGLKTIAFTGPLQLVEQGGHELGAGAS
jgi:hypothetical protein